MPRLLLVHHRDELRPAEHAAQPIDEQVPSMPSYRVRPVISRLDGGRHPRTLAGRREYDERGDLMREDMDSNLDGDFDRTIFWEEGLIVRSEMDHNHDGAIDQYRYYENGFLNRVLTDENHDGEVDRWAYYDRHGLQRVGTDRNSDGEADTWSERQTNP